MPRLQGGRTQKLFTGLLIKLSSWQDGEWMRRGWRGIRWVGGSVRVMSLLQAREKNPQRKILIVIVVKRCSDVTRSCERLIGQHLSGFYEKKPPRHVKPDFIKDHLSCLYGAEHHSLMDICITLLLAALWAAWFMRRLAGEEASDSKRDAPEQSFPKWRATGHYNWVVKNNVRNFFRCLLFYIKICNAPLSFEGSINVCIVLIIVAY